MFILFFFFSWLSTVYGGNRVFSGFFRGPEKREVRHDGAQGRKEGRNAGQGRASARAGRVPPFLQQTVKDVKGTGERGKDVAANNTGSSV